MPEATAHALATPRGIAHGARYRTGREAHRPLRIVLPAKRGRHAPGAHASAAAAVDGVDVVRDDTGGRKWLGRGGVVGGGAVSLAIGAVLGGVLEGVPHLLGPSATGGAVPMSVGGGSADTPTRLASGSTTPSGDYPWSAAFDPVYPMSVVSALSSAGSVTGSSVPSGVSPATGSPAGGAGPVAAPGNGVVVQGAQTPDAAGTPCDASCTALQGVGQAVSQVPGVGGPLSGALGQASDAITGATTGVGPALPGVPGSVVPTGSSALAGTLSGVASTASGILTSPQGSLKL